MLSLAVLALISDNSAISSGSSDSMTESQSSSQSVSQIPVNQRDVTEYVHFEPGKGLVV